MTTDGHYAFLQAVSLTIGINLNHAMLVKLHGADPAVGTRFSSGRRIGAEPPTVVGRQDPAYVSTSYIARRRLTMRMSIRRFSRLTNASSKKAEHDICTVSLHFEYQNFCCPQGSLRTRRKNRITPAMAAEITGRQRTIADLLALLPPVQHRGGRPENPRALMPDLIPNPGGR